MKKVFLFFVISIFLGMGFGIAENIKLKVEGPEGSYNQLRIVNNTKYENFNCKAFLLEKKGGKDVVVRTLGEFHLEEKGDTDSCTMKIKKNQMIGISLPDNFEEIESSVSYIDIPFFDIVKVELFNSGEKYKAADVNVGEEF